MILPVIENNMRYETKKKLTYACICASYLLTGLQYAIIFPSLNLFIKTRYKSSDTIFGVIIAAYSVSGFLAGPLFGYIVDKTQNSRTIVIIGNIANIIGNVMYMLGISPLFLILSRLVCGIGSGAIAAMFADITHSSTNTQRTGIISFLMMFQEIGLLFAPAFAIVLRHSHFYIGPFLIDKFTSPGLVMGCLYAVLQIFLVFAYFNLSSLHDREHIKEIINYEGDPENSAVDFVDDDHPAQASTSKEVCNRNNNSADGSTSKSRVNTKDMIDTDIARVRMARSCDKLDSARSLRSPCHSEERISDKTMESLSSEMIESAERYITSMSATSASSDEVDTNSRDTPTKFGDRFKFLKRKLSRQFSSKAVDFKIDYKNELLRDEVIVLFGLQFISAFSQTTLETITTPLFKKLYGWSDLENSYFYLAAGVLVLIVFILLKFLNRCVSDRNLILFGLLSMITSYVCSISLFVPHASPGSLKSMPYFIICAIFDLIGLPLIFACATSLTSKLTSANAQGFCQGVRRSCLFMGLILGPLWGGSTLKVLNVLFGVPLAVLLVITILFIISFKKLKISAEPDSLDIQQEI